MLRSVRWSAAIQAKGRWGVLEEGWWPLLAKPGMVLMRVGGDRKTWLVLHTTAFGFVGMRVQMAKRRGGVWCVSLIDCKTDDVAAIVVENHKEWKAVRTTCMCTAAANADPENNVASFSLVVTDGPDRLLPFACKQGLRGLTSHFLRLLFTAVEVEYEKGKKPRTEAELVSSIVAHVLKGTEHIDLPACIAIYVEDVPIVR